MRHAPALLLAMLALAALPCPAAAQHWSRSWAAAPQASPPPANPRAVPDLKDRTVRQIVRLSAGGKRFRLQLSNELTPADARIDSVRVVQVDANGAPVPGSAREVRFGGAREALLYANAPLLSDPIDLELPPLARIAISIHFPDDIPQPTIHAFAGATGWIAPGDQTAAATLERAEAIGMRLLISAVEVESRRPRATIVAFGDSITDGARITQDSDRRWPDRLTERLQAAGIDKAVANVGIGGNRVLRHGAADHALARFDRDALAVPGVSHVILLEGINDIGGWKRDPATAPSAAALIQGYRQLIARAHARDVKLILATIMPFEGAGGFTPEGEAVRQAVNAWIRTGREADGVVDLDRATADPSSPTRLNPAYDCGDKLHPNDAGFAAMANAIDLVLLK